MSIMVMNIWKNIFDRLVKSSQVQKCFKYIVHKHSFLHSGFFSIFGYIILHYTDTTYSSDNQNA